MDDLDLVVPESHARQAIEVLTTAGWSPLPTPLKGSDTPEIERHHPWIRRGRALADFSALYFRIRNGHGFSHPDGSEADLHWYVFHEQCDPGIDTALWDNAQSLQKWNRSPTPGVSQLLLMPDPTDHLLLVLSHANRWSSRELQHTLLRMSRATTLNGVAVLLPDATHRLAMALIRQCSDQPLDGLLDAALLLERPRSTCRTSISASIYPSPLAFHRNG